MKKKILFLLFLTLLFEVHCQKTIIIVDSIDKFPIENVQIFSSDHILTALSNTKGEILINTNLKFKAKKDFYHEKEFDAHSDTIFLSPKIQSLKEVNINPIDIDSFYKILVDTSNLRALNFPENELNGIYFEYVLYIDLKSHDSTYYITECNLNIHKKLTKQIDYSLKPFNGAKSIWTNKNIDNIDTSVYLNFLNITKKFNSLLEYDLTNKKKYNIDFENKTYRKSNDMLYVTNTKKKGEQNFIIKFEDNAIKSWTKSDSFTCDQTSDKIAICFELLSYTFEFSENPKNYYLRNLYLIENIRMAVNGKNYLIHLRKGFIETPQSELTNHSEIKHIEDYFKSIPYSNDLNNNYFYLFD